MSPTKQIKKIKLKKKATPPYKKKPNYVSKAIKTAALLSTLGALGFGAKKLYDVRKERINQENLEKNKINFLKMNDQERRHQQEKERIEQERRQQQEKLNQERKQKEENEKRKQEKERIDKAMKDSIEKFEIEEKIKKEEASVKLNINKLLKELKKSHVHIEGTTRDDACKTYDRFIKHINKGCEYSGNKSECNTRHIREYNIDIKAIHEALENLKC